MFNHEESIIMLNNNILSSSYHQERLQRNLPMIYKAKF